MAGRGIVDSLGEGSLEDLETIEGIGPKTADVLRRAGIQEVADLASFGSAVELHEYLTSQGSRRITLRNIENPDGHAGDWCHQARELTRRSTEAAAAAAAGAGAAPTAAADAVGDDAAADAQAAGSDETPAEPPPTPVAPAAVAPAPVAVEPVLSADSPGRPQPLTIERFDVFAPAEPAGADELVAAVRFRYQAQHDAAKAEAQAVYRVEILAAATSADVGDMAHALATWSGLLEPGRDPASASRGDLLVVIDHEEERRFTVPPVGRYRLYCTVSSLAPGGSSTLREGPTLNVVDRVASRSPGP